MLIPLEIGSRGDQVQNADAFKKQNWSEVLIESKLNKTNFIESIKRTYQNRENIIQAIGEENMHQMEVFLQIKPSIYWIH